MKDAFTRALSQLSAIAAFIGTCCVADPAFAAEGNISYLPGYTTGVPVGILPPPGVYFTAASYYLAGKLEDGHGDREPAKGSVEAVAAQLTWSSPYRVLGGHYGAGLIQILANHSFDAGGVGGRRSKSVGFDNTVLQPIILSWDLNRDLHVSFAQDIYPADGEHKTLNGKRDQDSYANNYWTFEPSVGISYLSNGWNLTSYFLYDINTTNKSTSYKTGDIIYVDLTATHKTKKFTYGAVGSVTQQLTDDRVRGDVVGNGNRASHIMAGPILAYDFGKVTLTAKYLADLRTRNDLTLSIAYLTAFMKF